MQKPKSVAAIKQNLTNTGATFSVTAFLARRNPTVFSQFSEKELTKLEQKALSRAARELAAGRSLLGGSLR